VTDENGRFVLMTDDGQTGAVVGKHRVRIQTKRDEANVFIDPETGSADSAPRSDAKKGGKIDPIPPEWYSDKSTKEFEVPAGGTDQANFDIPSIYAGKKK
jgi:hypothetical protein